MTAQRDVFDAWNSANYPLFAPFTYGTIGDDIKIGGNGSEDWTGYQGNDFFQGNGGNDAFWGDYDNDIGHGGTGNDFLNGEDGNDLMLGQEGDDLLIGDYGYDTLIGGAGNDLLLADHPWDAFEYGYSTAAYYDATGGVTVDLRVADVGADLGYATGAGVGYDRLGLIANVQGSYFNDIMWGNVLPNTLEGLDGQDTLSGDWGDDHLWGGFGVDELWGNQGNDFLHGGDLGDYLNGQEDHDHAWGDNGNDTVWGMTGNDTLSGGRDQDQVNGEAGLDELWGDEGNDTLNGGLHDDALSGGAGDDDLDGGTGADTMYGNAGDDSFTIDSIYDKVFEFNEPGTDWIIGYVSFSMAGQHIENLVFYGSANLNADGNPLNNFIIGNAGANVLTGSGGDDRFSGGLGKDTMAGGPGNDTYGLDLNSNDVVIEQADQGVDLVTRFSSFNLMANVENLDFKGTKDASALGNELNNVMDGNSGSNNLNGLLGRDRLTGSAGADFFSFSTALNGTTNVDTITDFSVVDDTIRLDDAVFAGLGSTGTLPAVRFAIGPSATDAADRIIYHPGNGALLYDPDGTGAQAKILFAWLAPNLALTNADFAVY